MAPEPVSVDLQRDPVGVHVEFGAAAEKRVGPLAVARSLGETLSARRRLSPCSHHLPVAKGLAGDGIGELCDEAFLFGDSDELIGADFAEDRMPNDAEGLHRVGPRGSGIEGNFGWYWTRRN